MDCTYWLILCWNTWNLHSGEDGLRLRTSCALMNSVVFLLFVTRQVDWTFFFKHEIFLLYHNSGYPIVNGEIRQMYVGPHTKYQLLCPLLARTQLFIYINSKTLIQNFVKIHPLVVLCWIDSCREANSFVVQLLYEWT